MRRAARVVRGLAICVWVAVCPAGRVDASFELERPGARAAGMGGAFCAVADDGDSIFYNPAGLSQTEGFSMAGQLGRLLIGLDDGQLSESRLAGVVPLGGSVTLGLGWDQRSLAAVYQENAFLLACGLPLTQNGDYRVGGALRILRADYLDAASLSGNDYFGENTGATGLGFDVGVLVRPLDQLQAGLSVANLLRPDVGLHPNGGRVPVQARIGAAYGQDLWRVSGEWLGYEEHYRGSVGGEVWWFEGRLGTRAGFAIGDGGAEELTAGLSLAWPQNGWGLQLDYAFLLPVGEFGAAGTSHLFNLTWRLLPTVSALSAKAAGLLATGERRYAEGKLSEALEAWEEAAELRSETPGLEAKIARLRQELRRRSEIELRLQQAKTLTEAGNLQNAAEAYRGVLALDPSQPTARSQLGALEARLAAQPATRPPAQEQAERLAGERLKQAGERATDESLRTAQRDLQKIYRLPEEKRPPEQEVRRLAGELRQAEERAEAGETEAAQVGAQAVSASVEKWLARLARRQVSPAKTVNEVPDRAPSPAAVTAPAPTAAAPAAQATPSDPVFRRARGAYGRAVKWMLDIDAVQGRKNYPEEYAQLQQEIARIKVLINREDYPAAIAGAEALYPRLEKLQKDSELKNKARRSMPTNW